MLVQHSQKCFDMIHVNKEVFSFVLLVTVCIIAIEGNAQVFYRSRSGITVIKKARQNKPDRFEKFKSHADLSVGYGFPNVDQSYLPDYFSFYQGNISQSGPFTGSLDYHFSRKTAIGIQVTHGIVSSFYYNYNYNTTADLSSFKARFDNWSILFSLVRQMPVNSKIIPYTRTSIGVHLWKQEYTDIEGNKADVSPVNLPSLAYQASIGAKFKVLKPAMLFIEVGYGKYILSAGLSFSFYNKTMYKI